MVKILLFYLIKLNFYSCNKLIIVVDIYEIFQHIWVPVNDRKKNQRIKLTFIYINYYNIFLNF